MIEVHLAAVLRSRERREGAAVDDEVKDIRPGCSALGQVEGETESVRVIVQDQAQAHST